MTSWDDYRFLLAVEASGSFSGAARMLGVSQPTVSRRMNDLETRLGVSLFNRRDDGNRLSELALQICAQAQLLQRQAAQVELTARTVGSTSPSRVRLTASEGIAYAIVTPLLARLHDVHSDLATDLTITNRPADLRKDEADIAIRVGDPVDDTLVGRRLGTVIFGLYGQDAYLARVGMPRTLDDLKWHSIIESTGELAQLPQVSLLRACTRKSLIRYSSNSILNQMVGLTHGLGLLALPSYLAADLVGIRRVLPQDFGQEIDVWILAHGARCDVPAVRRVLNWMGQEIASLLQRLDGAPDMPSPDLARERGQ